MDENNLTELTECHDKKDLALLPNVKHEDNPDPSSQCDKSHHFLSESTEMLSSEVTDKWTCGCIETSIEPPHSTSNPEDALTTYSDVFSSGESELEDLLYHFNNFFKSRLDQEVTLFQSNLAGILFEQQNHVRHIVTAVTDDYSQRSVDSTYHTSTVLPGSEPRIEHEPMITNQTATKLSYSGMHNKTPWKFTVASSIKFKWKLLEELRRHKKLLKEKQTNGLLGSLYEP